MKVTDPLCGNEIQLDDSLPRAEQGEWVYFFCSDECRRRFLENPERHAASPLPAGADREG